MSSDIVILDDIFDKESFPNVQSDLILKSNGSYPEQFYLLNDYHKYKQFCLKLINISGNYFDLSSCSGYENWYHENTKPPTWHIDCDERRKEEDNCMSFPLCSIVYYIKVDNLLDGKLYISHNDDVKLGDTRDKFQKIATLHELNHTIGGSFNQGSLTFSQGDTSLQNDNLNSTVINPKTNRMIIFPPGKFHMVERFWGTRISMVINPWDARKYKYSPLKEGYELIYEGRNSYSFDKNE